MDAPCLCVHSMQLGGSMLKADKSRPEGMAQLLHLTLTNPDARQLVAARAPCVFTALSGKGRMTQAAQGAADADVVKTRRREIFFPRQAGLVTTNVWVPA